MTAHSVLCDGRVKQIELYPVSALVSVPSNALCILVSLADNSRANTVHYCILILGVVLQDIVHQPSAARPQRAPA